MRFFLTGVDGYIGTVLGAWLLERGHDVLGLDTGYYQCGWLFDDGLTRPKVVTNDVRQVTSFDLEGFDAAVHLAQLSNDLLSENDPSNTLAINHHGSVALARRCKEAGVSRFVYASSCSIYGAGGADVRTESSNLNPLTAYTRCKVLVERDVKGLADADFTPVFLRNVTAFGASPRRRFDLVLNDLAGDAYTASEIATTSNVSPWRPLVYIEDIRQAVKCSFGAPREAVANQAFNVGGDAQNYRVRDIAEVIAAAFPNCRLSFGLSGGDARRYQVSFAETRQLLPDFRCAWNAERGLAQLRAVFDRIQLDKATFRAPPFTRLSELNHLKRTGQINCSLFWTQLIEERKRAAA